MAARDRRSANAFSLQLNTQFFTDPPACSGSSPSRLPRLAAVRLRIPLLRPHERSLHAVLADLLRHHLPGGWNKYDTGGYIFCYTNSPATAFGSLPANDLGDTTFVGQASSGGNDTVSLANSAGASSASNSDSKLDLASYWNQTEWGVFGDAGGSEANFGTDSTLEAVTTLQGTSSSAPACVADGTTGETNNLSFTKTKALGSESSPTMATKETNGTIKTPSCQVAS